MTVIKHFPPGDFKSAKLYPRMHKELIAYDYSSDECLPQRLIILHIFARFGSQESRFPSCIIVRESNLYTQAAPERGASQYTREHM